MMEVRIIEGTDIQELKDAVRTANEDLDLDFKQDKNVLRIIVENVKEIDDVEAYFKTLGQEERLRCFQTLANCINGANKPILLRQSKKLTDDEASFLLMPYS